MCVYIYVYIYIYIRTVAVVNGIPLGTGKVAQGKKKPFKNSSQICEDFSCHVQGQYIC